MRGLTLPRAAAIRPVPLASSPACAYCGSPATHACSYLTDKLIEIPIENLRVGDRIATTAFDDSTFRVLEVREGKSGFNVIFAIKDQKTGQHFVWRGDGIRAVGRAKCSAKCCENCCCERADEHFVCSAHWAAVEAIA